MKSGIERIFKLQKEAFIRIPYPGYMERKAHLEILYEGIRNNTDRFIESINADFGCRSPVETLLTDVVGTLESKRTAMKNFKVWMKPRRRPVSPWYYFARGRMVPQPLGVVGIIAPWNFPIYLTIGPLIPAIAAGNRVMVKCSEHSPRTSEVITDILRNSFAEDHVAAINGGPDVGAAFASTPFDHILYTGSSSVGRKVMESASKHLTPVTLELGGKTPAIIHPEFPLKTAVERIMFWKCLNAGQVCTTTDYVMVKKGEESRFVDIARETVANYYQKMADNPEYTSIINSREYGRLQRYLSDARSKGARIEELNPAGEVFDPSSRKIPPTLVLNVSEDMEIMQNEIFGTLLPIVPFETVEGAVSYINSKPRPLALYYFDYDRGRIENIIKHTVSGGVTVNDVVWHFPQEGLPTGGVGNSGMGKYHSIEGFNTFSNIKPVFYQSRLNGTWLLRPPYGIISKLLLKLMIR